MDRDIATLFATRPHQWGLRGDPHLWNDMAAHFAGVPVPASAAELRAALVAMFEQLTGQALATCADTTIHEKYAHGGMSSGCVHAPFWRAKGIPLLLRTAGFEGGSW